MQLRSKKFNQGVGSKNVGNWPASLPFRCGNPLFGRDFWDIPSGIIPEGREVLLASVDTGVDYTHPDLQNNSWINQAEIPEWMAEAGLDSDNDGYIEAEEVVNFLISEGMDINGDGSINLRDAVSDGSPFEDLEDNDNNGNGDGTGSSSSSSSVDEEGKDHTTTTFDLQEGTLESAYDHANCHDCSCVPELTLDNSGTHEQSWQLA